VEQGMQAALQLACGTAKACQPLRALQGLLGTNPSRSRHLSNTA
jgi:hypothetical protein